MPNKIPPNFGTYRPRISKDLVPSSARDLALVEQKQTQIVEAACKLFFERGFHGTNMREIAAEAGMSMGQLYHYISSKDDILFLVAKHMQELWYDYLVEFGFEDTEEPLTRLVRALRSSIEFPAKHKKLLQFIYTESKYLGKDHLEVILKMDDRNVSGFYRKLLKEVNQKHPLKFDVDLAARFLTFITVFISLRGWNLRKWSVEEITDFMVKFILNGLGLPGQES
jgi:AcrR family transcriptional regulator